MKFKQGIQQRISWFFGGFVLVLALSYSAASIVVAYIIEDEVLNRLVSLEIERMQRHYQKTGSIAPPSAAYFTVYDSINSAPSEIARVAKANAAGEVFSASGRHYHIRNLRIGPSLPSYANAILVADVTELLAVRNLPINIVVFLAGLIVLAITIALVGALVIAQRISSPIVALAEKVDGYEYTGLLKNGKSTGAKAKEDLVVPLDNEVDYLTLTIESTFKKLQAVIERESQFNRDVSHELRTPLTEIINTLALTEQQRLNAKAVSQLACSAYKMKNIVDVLLALARAESTKTDTFPLLPLIEECVLNQYAKIKENNFKIECDLSALTVVGNYQLVLLVISNLIDNAINHSGKPALKISVSEQTLHFENTVLELPSTDLTAPNSRHPESDGLGQGLYLVIRVLEALDWQYCISTCAATYRFSILPKLAQRHLTRI